MNVSTGAALIKAGAVVRLVAATLAAVVTTTGKDLEPDATFETMPSVLFDAVVVPDGDQSVSELASLGQALEFLKGSISPLQAHSLAGRRAAAARGSRHSDRRQL